VALSGGVWLGDAFSLILTFSAGEGTAVDTALYLCVVEQNAVKFASEILCEGVECLHVSKYPLSGQSLSHPPTPRLRETGRDKLHLFWRDPRNSEP